MHARGHSPGHLSFYWPERRALFAGDAIATWPYFSAGWPAFNLNIKQHKATVGRMAEFDAEIVAVGHGDPITNAGAARVRSLLNSGCIAATLLIVLCKVGLTQTLQDQSAAEPASQGDADVGVGQARRRDVGQDA